MEDGRGKGQATPRSTSFIVVRNLLLAFSPILIFQFVRCFILECSNSARKLARQRSRTRKARSFENSMETYG